MDHGQCNVIYFDPRAHREQTFKASELEKFESSADLHHAFDHVGETEAAQNVATILAVFQEVHLRTTSTSAIETLSSLDRQATASPTIIMIQTPHSDPIPPRPNEHRRSPSPGTILENAPSSVRETELRGFLFLHHVYEEIEKRSLSRLCLPIIVITGQKPGQITMAPTASNTFRGRSPFQDIRSADASFGFAKFLDAGAVDVMRSPLTRDRLLSLPSLAYRANKDSVRRASLFGPPATRKRSWVGADQDTRPFAYLREAMVTGLMDGICNPEYIDQSVEPADFSLEPARARAVSDALATWSFSAHDFDEDELLYASFCMLKHTLQMPGLDKWHMSDQRLTAFLLATRKVYNSFVLYHNFRHACDVTQALFYFLIQLGCIPPYISGEAPKASDKTPLAGLLEPFHALTMIIAAIGHDVGHPGVNNLFLVKLNAPLAQLYSDRSVLESFHCAAYTQILRRYWPYASSDPTMRKFMVNAILATDMGVHAQYIQQLKDLQETLSEGPKKIQDFDQKKVDENRDLLCCLLIKCADICNAARPIAVATQWATVLIDEFANQGDMEKELNMPSCLFGGPPVRNDLKQTALSQIGFMDMFAGPLFSGMASIFPTLRFGIDEISKNKAIWQTRAESGNETVHPRRISTAPIDVLPTFDNKNDLDSYQINKTGQRHSDASFGTPLAARVKKFSSPYNASPASSRKSSGHGPSQFQGLPDLNLDPRRRSSLGAVVAGPPYSVGSGQNSRRSSAHITSSPRYYNSPKEPSTTYIGTLKQFDGTGPAAEDRPPGPPMHQPSAGEPGGNGIVRCEAGSRQSDEKHLWTDKDEATTSLAAAGSDQTWGSSVSSSALDRGRKKKSNNPFGSLKFWKRKSRSVDSDMRSACGPTNNGRGKRSVPSSKSGITGSYART